MPAARDEAMIAADLGGTRLRVAVFDAGGAMSHRSASATPRDRPEALAEALREALAACDDLDVRGAVVAVPGPISYAEGKPVWLPNLPAWEGRISAQQLTAELGLPVRLANDADLAALGEHRYGAGRGVLDMLYVTSSTGVGAGVVIGGRLLRGQCSLAEAGHMIIERGSGGTVEELGSGTALARAAGIDGAALAAQARAGDPRAQAIFHDVADAFATGVYNLVHCFSPERVVIGGGVSQAGDLLLDPIRERLRAHVTSSSPDIVVAQGGDDVGLRGAFAFWSEARQ